MLLISWFALSLCVFGGDLTFKDPTGDDKGPGTYVYPTDAVYTQGSFDLTELQVSYEGDKVDFSVELNAKLDDPWGMGTGFAVQMVFIFIDTDGKAGSGHTEGLPGTNILFADDSAWDKVVILSPQKESRVISEARVKCPDWIDDIVVPNRTKGKGKKITGSVKLAELGGGDPATWGFQVVVQSNEGFPDKTDLLTRKVNEFEGQHRFGGGDDSDCDPHVMDILAGSAKGDAGEAQAQYDMLQYDCAGNKKATLHMVHAK
ncbi:MAG: hypothetical protein H6510_07525 [Acidobacteria bacterium]|nr:hypothetical protein [Acidobacteriota bacterium]MCB9397647.1 hypothetical protein [Acidobacteriota bacterium]